MENKCPKCGRKLRIFELKQNCPGCGCNIMYYDMEKRLEADSAKAEAEWAKLAATLDKITPKFVKNIKAKKINKKGENE